MCFTSFLFGVLVLYGPLLTFPVHQVSALFNFDPLLPTVPYWFLNFVSNQFCFVLIKLLRSAVKKVRDPSSEFARRYVAPLPTFPLLLVYSRFSALDSALQPTEQHTGRLGGEW